LVKKKASAAAFVLLLLFSIVVEFSSVWVAEANFMYPPLEKIYIKSDGSITPQTASISRVGDFYSLTRDIINCVIEVQRDNTVLNGAGYTVQKTIPAMGRQDAMVLKSRSNVTVKNFYVRGFGYGVFVSNSSGCKVSGNNFADNQFGVVLADQAADNFVSGNSFSSGGGISIYYSVNNILRNNSMVGSGSNFWIDCEKVSSTLDFVNDVDSSNTVNGKPICYWVNQHDRVVPQDAGFVALINCSGITMENLNLANNGQGAILISTTNSQVTKNNVSNNNKGFVIYDSQNNSFTWNSISNNTFGIVAYSRPNVFRNNRLNNNTNDVNFEDRFIDEFDYSNIVDGKSICYWIWQHDKAVPVDVGYVVLLSCSNITVQNLNITNRRQAMVLVGLTDSVITRNSITNNGAGLIVRSSSNNKILGNLVANNSDGVYMEASRSNEVSGNRVIFNANFGIALNDCSGNAIAGNYVAHSKNGFTLNRGGNNTVSENSMLYTRERGVHIGESVDNVITGNNIAWSNGWALTITGSVGNNKIHHNDFINNAGGDPYQAYPGSSTPNLWDDGHEGNFWSDYQNKHPLARAVVALGIWDTPVALNAINNDRYPLITPVNLKYQLSVLQPSVRSYNVSSVPLVFFVTAPVSWMGYSLDGKANVTVNGDVNLTNLSVGMHSVTAYAGDHEGAVCASETIRFEVVAEAGFSFTPQPTDYTSQSPQPTTNTPSPSSSLSPPPFSTAQPTSTVATQDTLDNSPWSVSMGWLALTAVTVAVIFAAMLFLVKKRKLNPHT
jgi:parallel beta-helix repeat protein